MDLPAADRQKSARSRRDGCIGVALVVDHTVVRDSGHGRGPVLEFTAVVRKPFSAGSTTASSTSPD